MKLQNTILAALALVIVATVALIAFTGTISFAGLQTKNDPVVTSVIRNYEFFASSTAPSIVATTTTATSTNIAKYVDSNGFVDNGYFVIAGAKEVNLLLGRGDTGGEGNTGTTTFKFQVTHDGSEWLDYTELRSVGTETTADGYFTRVSDVTAGVSATNDHAATSTSMYSMDTLGWYALRAIVVEDTDGEHRVRAVASF